jgi:hypothetical protein
VNFISQLLPGIRNVRAPLLAGYLWLLVAWLLFAGDLPTSDDAPVYERIAELTGAIGDVGLALIASVAAYLLGTLVMVVLTEIVSALVGSSGTPRGRPQTGLPPDLLSIEMIFSTFYTPLDAAWFELDRRGRERMTSLAKVRLDPHRQVLERSASHLRNQIASGLPPSDEGEEGGRPAIRLRVDFPARDDPSVRGWKVMLDQQLRATDTHLLDDSIRLPTFSTTRDIFDDRDAIKTQLMENTTHAGDEVDRLYSEAELRFAVSIPMIVALGVVALQSGHGVWLLPLAIPIGLLVHAVVLQRHAGRELIEALRSEDELDRVTPVFKRYAEDCGSLSELLSGIDSAAVRSELSLP